MYLKIDGTEIKCKAADRWADALAALDRTEGALGISVNGRTFSLNERVYEYAFAHVLTFADEEGRRIYERSLVMLFLAAAARVCPDVHMRIEHSYGEGLFIAAPESAPCEEIEKVMHKLAEADLPISRKTVNMDEALEYFDRTKQTERLRVLRYRTFDRYTLYDLDSYEDYFYGEMVPTTKLVNVFSLLRCPGGLVLMMPDKHNPHKAATYRSMPKLLGTYAEASKWYKILGCTNAPDLNEMNEKNTLREFVRVSEALQEKKIESIADSFAASGARIILIAGPSSSGKTTFANRLTIALKVLGLRPIKLSLDDYYLNRDTLPLEADGKPDLERVDALDLDLINEHLPKLLNGETVQMPTFDFTTGTRSEVTHALTVEKGQPIVIEGIHALNEILTASVPRNMKFKIYISALTTLNLDDHNRIRTTDARLLRRIVRDNSFRGTLPEETMALWENVRRGEDNYIFPFQEDADIMFNSSLPYELTLMKKYAYPALIAVQPESRYYTLARRLVKFLNYIREADIEDEIPPNSLLREFIGGCCFYREEK